jgi:PAS domain S-box-containing protein
MNNALSANGTSTLDVSASAELIVGAGEMADLVRSFDWDGTPLGPIREWSSELRALTNMLLASPDPMLIYWGKDLTLIYNDAARPIASVKHPRSLGGRARDVWKEAWHIVGPDVEKAITEAQSTQRKGVLVPLETDGVLRDLYWNYSYSPIYEGGAVMGTLLCCQNITDSVLTIKALGETEAQSVTISERLKMALSAADGIGIWDWDVKTNCVYTDARFAALYGVDPDKAANGMPMADFMKNFHGDDLARVSEAITRAIETGEVYEAEYRLVQPDNSVRWVTAKGRCVFDSDGQPDRFPGITVDITERKTTEHALRTSEERLTIAAETASLGTWEVDLETGRMHCSALCKANYGRSVQDEFNYSDLRACIHPEDAAPMQAAVTEAVENHSIYRFEYRIAWPDGTPHWVIASGRAFYDKAGQALRIAGVSMDVTERHQTQTALIQAEKLAAVGRLAASIAHEINNPLESVTNLLYLARGSKTFSEVQEYLETAERELRRVSVITSQTLRFYKQSSNPTTVTCEELFESVMGIYQGRLMNAKVEVEKRKRAQKAVSCFESEIRQVLNNLVGNAIDAMQPAGGRLLLRSTEGTEWSSGRRGLNLTIADSGPGIAFQITKKIFEAFYTTKGIGGTGLGLWVSQEIVARHHGALKVRSSQRPGATGTVMRLFLPFEAVAR